MTEKPTEATTKEPPSQLFTKENAKENARKAVEARNKRRVVLPDTPTLENLRDVGPEILAEVIRAGFGEGRWNKLDAKERINALKSALPYTLGRPGLMEKPVDSDERDDGAFTIGKQATTDS